MVARCHVLCSVAGPRTAAEEEEELLYQVQLIYRGRREGPRPTRPERGRGRRGEREEEGGGREGGREGRKGEEKTDERR